MCFLNKCLHNLHFINILRLHVNNWMKNTLEKNKGILKMFCILEESLNKKK